MLLELKHCLNNTYATRLSNGVDLTVLASDDCIQSYATLSFSSGHYAIRSLNTKALPDGMTHLLEHMLFSQKEDNEKPFQALIAQYNGDFNAQTENQFVSCYFQSEHEGFLEILHQFHQQITEPHFAPNALEREIDVLDSEFDGKKRDPARRLLSVQQALCDDKHPFSCFGAGNKDSLTSKYNTDELVVLLSDLHAALMHPANMSVCLVVSPSQFQTSITKGTSIFSEFASKHSANFIKNQKYGSLKRKLALTQIRNEHPYEQVLISFILANIEHHSINHQVALLTITHILESKHPKGLFNTLLNKGWIYELQSYYKFIDNENTELTIGVNLTDLGYQNYPQLIQIVWQYCQYLKNSGIEKWRTREKFEQLEIQFKARQTIDFVELSIECAKARKQFSFNQLLNQSKFTQFDSLDIVNSVYKQLDINSASIFVLSPKAEINNTTQYFEVGYHSTPFSLPNVDTVAFTKPRKNPYMSVNTTAVKHELAKDQVYKLCSNKVDLRFYQYHNEVSTEGECYLSITDRLMYDSAKHIAIKKVWLSCLNEYLESLFFDVDMADLDFRVYSHHHGVSLHTRGCSEKQMLLVIELLNAIKSYQAPRHVIERHLSIIKNRTSASSQRKPINQLLYHLNEIYLKETQTLQHVSQALSELDVEDLLEHQRYYFQNNYIENLWIGNFTKGNVDRMFAQIESHIDNNTAITKPHFVKQPILKSFKQHYQDIKNEGCTLVWHIIPHQSKDDSVEKISAISLMLEKILSALSFYVLREKHKLGYNFAVGYKPISGLPGVVIYIDSHNKTFTDIKTAMNDLFSMCADEIQHTSEEDFNRLRAQLTKQITPKDCSLNQTATRAWLNFEDDEPLKAYQTLRDELNNVSRELIESCLKKIGKAEHGEVILTSSNNNHIE